MADPTKDEMLESIEAAGEGASDFDIEEAIYWFASNYHSGQWSSLYSVLSASQFRPGSFCDGPSTAVAQHIYDWLVLEFSPQASSTN